MINKVKKLLMSLLLPWIPQKPTTQQRIAASEDRLQRLRQIKAPSTVIRSEINLLADLREKERGEQ